MTKENLIKKLLDRRAFKSEEEMVNDLLEIFTKEELYFSLKTLAQLTIEDHLKKTRLELGLL